jgi:hypothetical protein
VPLSQIPGSTKELIEVANYAALPATGEVDKIYITLDTALEYIWGGTVYAFLNKSIALGETADAAFRGDRGKLAYDHSQITTGNPHGTTKSDVALDQVDNTHDTVKPVSTPQANAISAAVLTETSRASAAEMLKIAKASNLADLANIPTARSNLGLNYYASAQIMSDSGRFMTLASPATLQSTVVSYTASTLSISSSTATVTNSTAGFNVTTFAVGTLVTMAGWTNSANNLLQVRVASITTTSMVLVGSGIETIVSEAAGNSVTIRARSLVNPTSLLTIVAANATSYWAGEFLHYNTNNTPSNTSGGMAPVVLSFLTATNRIGNDASYGAEFGFMGITCTQSDTGTYYEVFATNGDAWFGGLGNYLTKGFWMCVLSGAAKITSFALGSTDNSTYAAGDIVTTDTSWHFYKANQTVRNGYGNNFMAVFATGGAKLVITLPAAFAGLVPYDYSWAGPLIKY